MAVKLPKLSKKVLTILIAAAAILLIIAIVSVIAALVSDTNRLRYEIITQEYIQELEAQTPTPQYECLKPYVGTYAVVDVKDTYRGGIFAKEKLTIPSEYKGKPVSSIISLQNLQKIKELEISEGIVNITNSAFYGCTFEKIDIPSSVTYIGTYAFKECRSLVTVALPQGITTLPEGLFSECRALTSVSFVNITSIGKDVFNNCTSMTLKTEGGAKYLSHNNNDYYALVAAESADVTACTINSETKIIATSVFADCTKLTTATINAGVTYLPDYMFSGCYALTSISIPNTVETIGSRAFANCTALTAVEFGSGLKEIGTYAFTGCSLLAKIDVPANVKTINNYAFSGCSNLDDVTLHVGLEKLGNYVFSSCSKLESITFSGTKAQWEGINKSTSWNRNATNLKTVVCSGDEIVEL